MTPSSTLASPPASAVVDRRHLVIELHGSAHSTLLRALAMLHRRRFRVLWLRYTATGLPAHRLDAVVEGPASHAHRLEAWLSALVDVRAVTSSASAVPE
jgi:acetolactate synthase regulatory subunit